MKKRRIRDIALTVFLTATIVFASMALVIGPNTLDIGTVDLNMVGDGSYIGICQNKILHAVVKVDVKDYQIVGVEILEHKESYMKQAEMIADDVITGQTLEVDAVSGATLTSVTILKAIENALFQGRK